MFFSDPDMFLFEIVVEGLKSYTEKEFHISLQYGHVFTLDLKDPNKIQNKPKKFKKRKVGVRHVQRSEKEDTLEKQASETFSGKLQSGQSILLASDIPSLISSMHHFPMELSLWADESMREKLGSSQIPWSPVYLEYLGKVNNWRNPAPAVVSGGYDIYDDYTSKRLATVRLNIKLTHLADNTSTGRLSSEDRNLVDTRTNISKAASFTSTKEEWFSLLDNTTNMSAGTIKTSYGSGRLSSRPSSANKSYTKEVTEKPVNIDVIKEYKPNNELDNKNELIDSMIDENRNSLCKSSISKLANTIRSNTDLSRNQQITPVNRTKSCLSLKEAQYNILNYIFGDTQGPLHDKTYCVGYFTVQNDRRTSRDAVFTQNTKCNVRVCDQSSCPSPKNDDGACIESTCLDDLLKKAAEHVNITRCKDVRCRDAKHPALPVPPDERILLDITNLNKDCCGIQTVEEVTGGVNAQMKLSEDKCFCECSCTFGFVKRTTYCGICGGYEKAGEDFPEKPPRDAPFPCPIYHKYKKAKAPVEVKKKKPGCDKDNFKKDDRFKFNYGYAGIPPQIGHSQCAMPCTGTMGSVPKKMGWLWTADNVPGLRFRPAWKPGAVNKQVLHLLRLAKNPEIASHKKRKKETQKKPSKRPLLVVHKKDGEFNITMETMRNFPKRRYLNQQPFEEKPPITYTIGRTDEENAERKKKKERAKRRLERDQREFIQSAFRDMCKDICVKTYQQALGILPNAEDPDCTCFPAEPGPEDTNMDRSCSCSEDTRSLASDTDDDEWIVEFTPPSAMFDPKYREKKIVTADNSTQYTYLDYKVKLLDYSGNPVPRYFKGLDGRTLCSDLGGFWGPDKKWLEINTDGFIAPDGRWAPMDFMVGTERVTCDMGKFQLANMNTFVVGVDGYVDNNGVWKSYSNAKNPTSPPIQKSEGEKKKPRQEKQKNKKNTKKKKANQSEASWSCFGDVTPHTLSKLGIVGHGHDKQILMSTLQEMIAGGADIKIPERSTVPTQKLKEGKRPPRPLSWKAIDEMFNEKTKCHHSVPSEKGIVAMDKDGNKTYFRMKKYISKMPKERLKTLTHHGISLSSFHTPCFSSFINTQMKRQQVYDKYRKKKPVIDNQTGW